jgi:hypothetical protein
MGLKSKSSRKASRVPEAHELAVLETAAWHTKV